MIAKSLKTFQINCKKVKMNRYKFGMVALILFCSSPLALFTGTTIFLSVKNIEIPTIIVVMDIFWLIMFISVTSFILRTGRDKTNK